MEKEKKEKKEKRDKVKTHASKEPMRWAETEEAPIARGPTDHGNDFDIRMRQEADGQKAAKKIVDIIAERGVCLVEANAPADLLAAACDEAEQLWEDGHFSAPFRVSDDRSMMEAKLWHQAVQDEEKVVWIKQDAPGAKPSHMMNALKLLAKNISDFSGGLGPLLKRDAGIDFDKYGQTMLSCYTGDRQYNLHLDNPHGEEEDEHGLPDNGMRLTSTYFINVHWNPNEGSQEGGLDVHLTGGKAMPDSLSAARASPKLRVAPHADTLVLFLSERMAHQVIKTSGKEKWFALTMWSLNGPAMQQMAKRLMIRQMQAESKDDSDVD